MRRTTDSRTRNTPLPWPAPPDPHSAGSQFFINTKDNAFLDFKSQTPQGWGYAVFGKVIKGQDVVDKIADVSTGKKGFYEDVPNAPVIIKKATVIE